MSIQVTPIPRITPLAPPAFTLGTANAGGTATTAVASDSTLLAFDTTLPDAITFGQSGAVGTATTAARRSHAHAMASVDAATQAEMEAASSTTVFDTPGRTQYHPGVAKAWAHITQTGTQSLDGSYGVSSITDNATGNTSIIFTTSFSNAFYSQSALSTTPTYVNSGASQGTRAEDTGMECRVTAGTATDAEELDWTGWGDQ